MSMHGYNKKDSTVIQASIVQALLNYACVHHVCLEVLVKLMFLQ